MKNTKTTNKKTLGAKAPGHSALPKTVTKTVKATTSGNTLYTRHNEKKGLIDIMIDFDEMLSKRSLAEIRARKKLAADFARFKSETNTRLTALEAVS